MEHGIGNDTHTLLQQVPQELIELGSILPSLEVMEEDSGEHN
jgi:hypothetical protein